MSDFDFSTRTAVVLRFGPSLAVSILAMALTILINAIPLHNADTQAIITSYFGSGLNWRRLSHCLALHVVSPSILL